MGNVAVAKQIQTLYVTIRRDELHDLKAERDQLKRKVAQLSAMVSQAALHAIGTAPAARLA
jgi:cell division protein FtsB